MEAIEIFKARRSCKKFTSKPLEEEKLDQILEAGTYAPTGLGRQSPIIVAVRDPEMVKLLSKMNAEAGGMSIDPFYGASTVLVVLADRSMPTYIYDGSLVMGNLLNAAEALGVNACWIHRAKEVFDSEQGKALLRKWGIDGDYEGIGNCILGYGEKNPEKPRKENYIVRV